MHHAPLPLTRDLVLIGGGHTHALVLRSWGMNPLPGARLTLINPGPTAPYSGMLPGHLAGHYTRDALDIDLVRLARFAGARLILGAVDGIDLNAATIHVPNRPAIGFDAASIDIGITSAMPDLPGFAAHAVPAKPLGRFAERWTTYRTGSGPASVAVIGGGVAGVEIAMALAHALRADNRPAQVHVIEAQTALSALSDTAARRLRHAMSAQGITLIENAQITQVTAEGLHLSDGRQIEAQFITGAAGARPYDWLTQTGLMLHNGFVTVDDRLRSSDARVYAVGDCAYMASSPRPKAGVYAVRQAPVLLNNLRAALSGSGGQKPYHPQRDYLKLISLGKRSAQASRFGLTLSGPAMWRWKDRIDQAFMDKFLHHPAMKQPALPWPRALEMREALGPKPMCGGCGSKIGRGALGRALSDMPAGQRADITILPGDDAALLQTGGARQVLSTDHLRAMVDDPAMMTRIAAIHALGDIWAMGAAPQAATASVILPRMSATLAERSLREIMATAQEVMQAAGAQIVGGHSTQGAELTIGFTLTGLCDHAPITLQGARPGDSLILTKPIGSGVIMAADMAGLAPGAVVAAALDQMTRAQGDGAALLSDAHAMTDVTGFGLAGHLVNLCDASHVGAELWLETVPLMQGALTLSQAGVASTLYRENRAILPLEPEDPHRALLFDPQTGGGLLAAAAPGSAGNIVDALRQLGHDAAVIGQITDTPGQIRIV